MFTHVSNSKLGFITSLVAPFLECRLTGLDISDLSMKYLAFDRIKKNNIAIRTYGEIQYPQGIITHGEIKDEQAFITILSQWLEKEKKKLPSSFVAFSLPEEKSFIRSVQIPRVKREEVANAIRWEIENQIPLPLEELVYDYEIIEPSDQAQDHFDVIITAFPRNILGAYLRVIQQAGLELYAAELESQSIVRACVSELHDPEAKIIVDVGKTRTTLAILARGAILYTSTIEAGGMIFEQYIAKQLNVEAEEATRIKINVGLDKTQKNGEVFDALAPIITMISDELVRAISYYQTHASHAHNATSTIGRILLSGGDGNLRGLDTYLASVLKIPVDRANSFAAIQHLLIQKMSPLTKREAPAFATAIGLALREIRQT